MSINGISVDKRRKIAGVSPKFLDLADRISPRKSIREITEMIACEWEGKLNSGKKIKLFMKSQEELLFGKKNK